MITLSKSKTVVTDFVGNCLSYIISKSGLKMTNIDGIMVKFA